MKLAENCAYCKMTHFYFENYSLVFVYEKRRGIKEANNMFYHVMFMRICLNPIFVVFLISKDINHWDLYRIEQNNKKENKDNISDEWE